LPSLQRVANPIDVATAINRVIDAVNLLQAEVDGGSGQEVRIGRYALFVDVDGSLKVRAPNGTLVTLVVKT